MSSWWRFSNDRWLHHSAKLCEVSNVGKICGSSQRFPHRRGSVCNFAYSRFHWQSSGVALLPPVDSTLGLLHVGFKIAFEGMCVQKQTPSCWSWWVHFIMTLLRKESWSKKKKKKGKEKVILLFSDSISQKKKKSICLLVLLSVNNSLISDRAGNCWAGGEEPYSRLARTKSWVEPAASWSLRPIFIL